MAILNPYPIIKSNSGSSSQFRPDYRWWVGTDGNIWANIEGSGVRNLGKYGQANNTSWLKAINASLDDTKRIADPNAGQGPTSTTTSDDSKDYSALLAQQAAENAAKASEAQNIKNSMLGRRAEFESILNNVLGNIDKTYKEESDKRKETYDEDAAALLDTLEKALPEIASSFASIGAYDSSLRGYREMDAEKEHQSSQKELTKEYEDDMANLGNKANQARTEANNSYRNFMTDFDTLNSTDANADNLKTIRSSQNSLLKGLNDFSSQAEYYKPNSDFANQMKALGENTNFDKIASSLKNFLTNAGASSGNFSADKQLATDTKATTDKVKSEVETNKATGVSK